MRCCNNQHGTMQESFQVAFLVQLGQLHVIATSNLVFDMGEP